MGIHNLAKLLAERAPSAIKENEMKLYFGRKVAIDASMCIYQFLIAVRQDGSLLTNESGEVTSHLMGTFYRTIRMIENGLKPIYVFDGKPPEMKSQELSKRTGRREEAEAALKKAEEEGNVEDINKFNKRLVKVTREHNEECKKLLTLMGVPVVSAPCEAEAQCAELVKSGKAFAIGTEDMDGLTFGASVLLRHLTASESKKLPIKEFNYNKILEELQLNRDEFIDLCILMGCDYCESIKGIGQKKALDLITQYRSIDKIIENIDKTKYPLPEPWPYKDARRLFQTPEVTPGSELDVKMPDVDEEGLVQFMVHEKGFAEDRIRNGAKKLLKARSGTQQIRLDSFFKASPAVKPAASPKVKQEKGAKGGTPKAKLSKVTKKSIKGK